MLVDKTVSDFLNELASNSPAPGGGSVAALSGALGAALTSMVCNLTVGKKKYLEVTEEISGVLKASEELRRIFIELIDKDTQAFNKVMDAYGLPKDTDAQKQVRHNAIEQATKPAAIVPMEVIRACGRMLELTKVVAQKGNQNSISDAGVSALLVKTACDSAALNVRINLSSISDRDFSAQMLAEMQSATSKIQTLTQDILRTVNEAIEL